MSRVLLLFVLLLLSACGGDSPTQTPIVIVVTATPEPPSPTPSPTATVIVVTATPRPPSPTPSVTATVPTKPTTTATATVPTKPTATRLSSAEVSLGELVTAKVIGEDNRPVTVTDTYRPTDTVYAVIRVHRFAKGHRVFARWILPIGGNEDTAEIVADQTYRDVWLEFHISGADRPLPKGEYEVVFYVDGWPAADTSFVVR